MENYQEWLEKQLREAVRIIKNLHDLADTPHLDHNFEFIESVEAMLGGEIK